MSTILLRQIALKDILIPRKRRLVIRAYRFLKAQIHLSINARKRNFGHVRPAKIQISLCIRAVLSEDSLDTFWMAKNAKFLHADNRDYDQTVAFLSLC